MAEQHESERLADQALQRFSPQVPVRPMMDPAHLLSIAVQRGDSLEMLERLMDLKERDEQNMARKAYVASMAAFKRNPPTLVKDKHVAFQTSKGMTEYDHATLGNVCGRIVAALSAVGISHRWDTKQPDGGMIEVTCTLTHELGHSESTTLKAGRDDSGGKNSIQQIASTVSYLQRYTLLSATGLATNDMQDADGRGSEVEYITADQIATVDAKLDELGGEKVKRRAQLCRYLKLDSIETMPTKVYPDAIATIDAQIKAQAAKLEQK